MWIIWRESLLLSVSRCCASSQGSSRQTAENWIVRVWPYWPKTAPLTSWYGLVSTPRWWSITCTTSCPVKRLPTKRCLTGYSFFTLGTGWGPTWLHCPQTSPGPWFWRGSRSLHQHCTTSIGYNWGIMNVLIHLCLAPPVQSTRLKYCYRLGCNHITIPLAGSPSTGRMMITPLSGRTSAGREIMTGSIPRHPLFIHAISFEWTTKL